MKRATAISAAVIVLLVMLLPLLLLIRKDVEPSYAPSPTEFRVARTMEWMGLGNQWVADVMVRHAFVVALEEISEADMGGSYPNWPRKRKDKDK